MSLFHCHKWSKWVEYEPEFSRHIAPWSEGNWYGLIEIWSEKGQKRICLTCGEEETRKVHGGKMNLKVSPVVLGEEK